MDDQGLKGNAKENVRLADLFAELFILATHLRSEDTGNFGGYDTLRRSLLERFSKVEQKGKALGIPYDLLQQARYAVVALLDEVILSSSWSQKDQWSAKTLQYEFFGENMAGVEFFNKLEALRRSLPRDRACLEVYYLCLVLGFEGQYKIHGQERRKELVEALSQEFQSPRGETPALSPNGKRPEELIEMVKQGLPAWIMMVCSGALLFFFYITLRFLLGYDTRNLVNELSMLVRTLP